MPSRSGGVPGECDDAAFHLHGDVFIRRHLGEHLPHLALDLGVRDEEDPEQVTAADEANQRALTKTDTLSGPLLAGLLLVPTVGMAAAPFNSWAARRAALPAWLRERRSTEYRRERHAFAAGVSAGGAIAVSVVAAAAIALMITGRHITGPSLVPPVQSRPAATSSPTPSATPSPTASPTASPTPSASPTASPTPSPTASPTASPTPTTTPTVSPTSATATP
jgi:hypothetical protein